MKFVEFELISNTDDRIYLKGNVDIDTIDDDESEWEYEQNNGTYSPHIPHYWKTSGADLTDEFENFINTIDWEMLSQYLCDFQDDDVIVNFYGNTLIINEGEKANKSTTIKVSQLTKEKLDSVKIHHRETYEDVILRLLSQQ